MTLNNQSFELAATITLQENRQTVVTFTLPQGQQVCVTGPLIDEGTIGSLSVIFYPDLFVQIIVVEQAGLIHQKRIPIADIVRT